MPKAMIWCSILTTMAVAAPAPAQLPGPGTIVFSIHVKLPDSVKIPVPIGNAIDLRISLMSDGRRFALDLEPGPDMAAGLPMLQGARVLAVYAIGGDTLHAGLLLPPSLGTGPGYRVDVPIKTLDSLRRSSTGMLDSITRKIGDSLAKAMPHPTYRALGTTATVAGIRCEEWETVIASDTTRTCVIPTPVALLLMQNYLKQATGAQQVMDQLPGFSAAAKAAYGGREMTSIRTTNARTGLRIELVSYTAGAPAATVFDMPAGLQTLPGMGAKPPAGGGGSNRQ